MTRQDNTVDMVRPELLLREHFARTDKHLAEFHALMVKEFNEFTEKVNTRLDRVKATAGVIQNNIASQKYDMAE